MYAATLLLAFLVLYPLFWLIYGSLTYGEHGFVQTVRQFWAIKGLRQAFQDTALHCCSCPYDSVIIGMVFCLVVISAFRPGRNR